MPSQNKKSYVQELADLLTTCPHFILVNFGAASHTALEGVRRQLIGTVFDKAERPVFKVVKNSLLKVAIKKKTKLKAETKQALSNNAVLVGPSAVISLSSNYLPQLKIFHNFAKGIKGVSFKVGFIDGAIYGVSELIKLAELPSFEALVAKILGSLKSPQSRLVMGMKYNMNKLVYVLKNAKPAN